MEQPAATGAGGEAAPWRPRDTVVLAVALGLAIGFGEVAGLGWRYLGRGLLTHITPHAVWMAPVTYAAFFLLLTPLAIVVGRLRPGAGPAPAIALLAGLGLVGWLEMAPWSLHPVAVWILAFGLALRLALAARSRTASVRRAARVGVTSLTLLVVIGAVTIFVGEWRRERRALAALPAAGAEAPNVLLLLLDTVRAKSLGLYGGDPRTSPNLDALASSSVVFERAISTAPWTLPSHASMFTGRWPHELSVGWNDPLDDAEPTLAEALAGRGYATAGFVGNLAYTSRQFGLARGFARYEDFPLGVGQAILTTSLGRTITTSDALRAWLGDHELLNRKPAPRLRRDLMAWLDRRPADRPFFAFVNFYDAHEPYEPERGYRERFVPGFRRSNVEHRHNLLRGVNARRLEKWAMSEEEVAAETALYEAAIAWLDEEIGGIVDDLEERGLLERTVLVVTSDHGEQMGEHGLFGHMQSLYLPATHVPLVIRPAGGTEPRRVARPVSLVDLPATLLDLTGASTAWPGRSLRPLWGGEETVPSPAMAQLARGLVEQPWYPIARGLEMQSLVRDGAHYICNPDASEELYDLASDPDELRNLIGTPEGDARALALRAVVAPVGAPPTWCPPPSDEAPRPP